jgi:hypothetical protein
MKATFFGFAAVAAVLVIEGGAAGKPEPQYFASADDIEHAVSFAQEQANAVAGKSRND